MWNAGLIMKKLKKERVAFTWYFNWRYPIEAIRDLLRQTKYFFQRGMYGYADEDYWSLDGYLCKWLPGALRRYKKSIGYPGIEGAKTPKEWGDVCEKMARGFEAKIKQDEITWSKTEDFKKKYAKLQKEYEEGMALFVKWFDHLWD